MAVSIEATITRRPAQGRNGGSFDLESGGKRLGFLSYSLDGTDTLMIDYVQVDPSLRGSGLGAKLVAAAVDWAKEGQYKVVPICGFARSVLRRQV
jgi:predicted GNAT family acetyltransferase